MVLKLGEDPVPLLACSVPDLELDAFVVDLQLPDPEVHADRRQEALVEHVVRESAQDVRLTGTAVADDQDFEYVVVLSVHPLSNICNK